MGDQRDYVKQKTDLFSYTYNAHSARLTINGVTGRMIAKKPAFKTKHADLPAYRKTCDIYFSPDPDGKAIQAKLYDQNGKMRLDFDWNHSHTNPDGTHFPKGTIHVQEYKVVKVRDTRTGKYIDKFKRLGKQARRMTEEEVQKYGPILLHFNPELKF